MARSLSAGMVTEVQAKTLSPIILVKAEFDAGNLTFWSGVGSLSYGGDTYIGAGNFLAISPVVESVNVEANGVNITLAGLPTSLIATALAEDYQGRYISAYFACLDASGALIADPYKYFGGRMDVMEIFDAGETATITIRSENLLIDFRRKKTHRYTDEDQKAVYTGDRGLEFVDQMQDRELIWGKATPT